MVRTISRCADVEGSRCAIVLTEFGATPLARLPEHGDKEDKRRDDERGGNQRSEPVTLHGGRC